MRNRFTGERGWWLTFGLMYIALSNAWWCYRALNTYWDLVSHRDPRFAHWPFLLLGILSAIAVLGVVGLWLLRKWGLYLYLVCWVAAVGVGFYLRITWLGHLLSLVNVLVLYVFLWPRRDELR
jgi:hypothetical protein